MQKRKLIVDTEQPKRQAGKVKTKEPEWLKNSIGNNVNCQNDIKKRSKSFDSNKENTADTTDRRGSLT